MRTLFERGAGDLQRPMRSFIRHRMSCRSRYAAMLQSQRDWKGVRLDSVSFQPPTDMLTLTRFCAIRQNIMP
jgi:hypothetical protein